MGLVIILESNNLLLPLARLLTMESRLLLINLKLSMNLSSISLDLSSLFLMYLSTSTLIKKDIESSGYIASVPLLCRYHYNGNGLSPFNYPP